ncbi:MAG: hypothetical protein KGJ30_05160 [Burkholderiales bacterium]|nr:hypothetical protein [Burkholderiales bacterium]MDE1926117.1 hypothetical protein [Burkholderiales bacterium]MDE2158290.1 hypothetical protein [Burkholderiales bacterium]
MTIRYFPKVLVAATLAAAALGAQARPDVYLSIGLQAGPVWVQAQPVYVPPQPVYVQPAPMYARPPVWVPPRVMFERQGWRGYDAREAWERERAWRRAEWHRHDRYDGYRGGDRDDD